MGLLGKMWIPQNWRGSNMTVHSKWTKAMQRHPNGWTDSWTLETLNYFQACFNIIIRAWTAISKVQASKNDFVIAELFRAQIMILFISCLENPKYRDNLNLILNFVRFAQTSVMSYLIRGKYFDKYECLTLLFRLCSEKSQCNQDKKHRGERRKNGLLVSSKN